MAKEQVFLTLHKQVEEEVELVKLVLLVVHQLLVQVETDQLIQLVERPYNMLVEAAVDLAQQQLQAPVETAEVELVLLVAVEPQKDKMELTALVAELVALLMTEHILMHQVEMVLYF